MESAPDKKKILDMPLGIAINFPLLFAFTIAIVGRAITIWRDMKIEAMNQSTNPIQKMKQRG